MVSWTCWVQDQVRPARQIKISPSEEAFLSLYIYIFFFFLFFWKLSRPSWSICSSTSHSRYIRLYKVWKLSRLLNSNQLSIAVKSARCVVTTFTKFWYKSSNTYRIYINKCWMIWSENAIHEAAAAFSVRVKWWVLIWTTRTLPGCMKEAGVLLYNEMWIGLRKIWGTMRGSLFERYLNWC